MLPWKTAVYIQQAFIGDLKQGHMSYAAFVSSLNLNKGKLPPDVFRLWVVKL